jgi:hypothetical protein
MRRGWPARAGARVVRGSVRYGGGYFGGAALSASGGQYRLPASRPVGFCRSSWQTAPASFESHGLR